MVAVLLLADIGGTNARFGLRDKHGQIRTLLMCPTQSIGSVEATLKRLQVNYKGPIDGIVVAAAGPLKNDRIVLTNAPTSVAIKNIRDSTGIKQVRLINDLAALANSVPLLKKRDLRQLIPGAPSPGAPRIIVAPGTGLGAAILLPIGHRKWTVLPGEAGHGRFPESALHEEPSLSKLQGSRILAWEYLVSGNGLPRIYRAMRGVRRRMMAEEIARRAAEGDKMAVAAARGFSFLLGLFVQQMALMIDGRGGCFIGGGVVPALGPLFHPAAFRRGFRSGTFERRYLSGVPVHLIIAENPTFLGLAALFDEN